MGVDIWFKAPGEPKVFDESLEGGAEGRITIRDFWENFSAMTSVQSVGDYESSWTSNLQALRRREDAFFLTDVGSFGVGWPSTRAAWSISLRSSSFRQMPTARSESGMSPTDRLRRLLLDALARRRDGGHIRTRLSFGTRSATTFGSPARHSTSSIRGHARQVAFRARSCPPRIRPRKCSCSRATQSLHQSSGEPRLSVDQLRAVTGSRLGRSETRRHSPTPCRSRGRVRCSA